MGRKEKVPGTNRTDQHLYPYDISGFGSAVIRQKGLPSSEIPGDALADGLNVVCFPRETKGRTGSRLYTSTKIPALEGRTDYTASQTGDIITANLPIFSQADAGNYWVWPGVLEDEHDEIIEYISDTQVRVFHSAEKPLTAGCWMRGKTNLWKWHKIQRQFIFQFGEEVYVSEYAMASFQKCHICSNEKPSNSISGYDDLDKWAGIIHNSRGMFRIDFGMDIPKVYKINTPIPNIAILEEFEEPEDKYEYHYLYSVTRIHGDGNFRNRLAPARIEVESGTNIWDDAYKDYSTIYSTDPIGPEVYRYGMLTCGRLQGAYQNIGGWRAAGLSSFFININNAGFFECVGDFTDVTSMSEVAFVIQASMRPYFPYATAEYTGERFIITGGRVENGEISFTQPGTAAGTTDISDHLRGTAATGAERSRPYIRSPKLIGPLYVPIVPNTNPLEYQWHLTHFPIYRTEDLRNTYKIGTDVNVYNDKNDFMWNKDLRICAAGYGYRMFGLIILIVGEFEQADVGSIWEWENGIRDEILEVINSRMARYAWSGDYYYEPILLMAGMIGNGRVMRAYQVGNRVYRTHGSKFTEDDVRKPLKWSIGYYSYVTDYVDGNQVIVEDDMDKDLQGLTLDPRYRHYYDVVSDETLETRRTALLLKQRFWRAMPSGNVGAVVPGLIINAMRGDGQINYGQVPDTLEYLNGYHDPGYQISSKIRDDIQFMFLFQDVLTIWTSNKTWRWPTSSYEYITNPNTKDAILQITGIEVADEDRGLFDWGSIEPVGGGAVLGLFSEPGGTTWRLYNGYQYGPNILEIEEIGAERIPEIQDLQQATKALYDGRIGLMLWGRNK